MLAAIMTFDPKDPRSLEEWALHHFAEHNEVRAAIFNKGLSSLPQYELYPVNWADWEGYALRHQLAHNEANGVLKIGGTDFRDVNFRDQKQLDQWHADHMREHLAWRTTLGI